jgi:aspartyl aminopeptidase
LWQIVFSLIFFMTMMLYPASPEAATRFLKFVNASPTPFQAVANAALRLEKAGFQKVCASALVIV